MKCAECGKRNSDDNSFCVSCAAPLHHNRKHRRVFLPPQESVLLNWENRKTNPSATFFAKGSAYSLWLFMGLLIAISVALATGLAYYYDTYQIEDIDYANSINR